MIRSCLILLVLLSCSCASRKTQIKRYVDEVLQASQGSVISCITNSRISDDLTINFRTIEFDTTGRKVRETAGKVTSKREETLRDSIVKRDSTQVSSAIKTTEQVKEKKSRGWHFFVIGIASALLFVLIIYIVIRRAK